jgi:predicted transcriptional regulator
MRGTQSGTILYLKDLYLKNKKALDKMTSVMYIVDDRCHREGESREAELAKRNLKKLSDANLEIMKLAWQRGEVSINDVLEAVNRLRKDKVKRATVQVQMRRLEKYGWLKHRREKREFYYSPLRGEAEAKLGILHNVRDRVFGGSYAELVKCLFAGGRVPEDELKRIIEFLNESDKE